MVRQTKKIRFARIAQGVENLAKGKRRPMPTIRVDGSVSTRPCVPCPDIPESEVPDECVKWMTRHGCNVKRLNNGAGRLMLPSGKLSEFQQFGIKGGGDYIGMLPDGRHLEVEFKKGKGGTLSKAQVKQRKWVTSGGGVYVVAHGLPEIKIKLLPILEKCVDNGRPPW